MWVAAGDVMIKKQKPSNHKDSQLGEKCHRLMGPRCQLHSLSMGTKVRPLWSGLSRLRVFVSTSRTTGPQFFSAKHKQQNIPRPPLVPLSLPSKPQLQR